MRPDVKLGIVVSLVVVLGIGGYFLLSGKREAPIPVTSAPASTATKPTVPSNKVDRSATKPNTATPRKPESVTIPPAAKTADANPVKATAPGTTPPVSAPTNPASPVASNNVPGAAPSGTNAATPSPTSLTSTAMPPAANNIPNTVPPTTPQPNVAAGNSPVAAPTTSPANATVPTETRTAQKDNVPTTAPRSAPPASPFANPATPVVATSLPASTAPSTENAANETHKVQSGDSFASLSRRYYGSERHVEHLLKANPQIKDPARLSIGTMVTIPPEPQGGIAAAPVTSSQTSRPTPDAAKVASTEKSTANSRTYQVKSGDSFYGIARDVLGDANRWNELLALNREKVDGNPNRLRVGQVLVLPGT